MTSLSGNLSSGDLANIFQMLALGQKEGTLYIQSETGTKAIYFTRDGVQMRSRGKSPFSLGRILLRFGAVTEERLQYALDRQSQGDVRRLGEVLIDIGALDQQQLERALRTQIEEEIYNLFIWKSAGFEFKEGPPDDDLGELDPSATLTFNVNSIIMESARRMDEWEYIRGLVPASDIVYQYTGTNIELDDAIFETPWAGMVLAAIDGKRSVDELIEASYANKFDVCKLLSLLVSGGAVAPLDDAALKSAFFEAARIGDVQQSQKFLTRLEQHGADNPKMHAELARLMEGQGEFALAAKHFRSYAEAQAEGGNAVKAFETYHRIVDFLPTDITAAARLADLYTQAPCQLGEHRESVLHWGNIVAASRSALGQHIEASISLERMVSIDPDDADLHNRLAQAYLACGKNAEAVTEFEGLAQAASEAGDDDRYERLLQNILLVEPKRHDIRNQLQKVSAQRAKRRSSWKTFAIGAVVVVVVAVGAWFGIDQFRKHELEAAETAKAATAELDDVLARYTPLAAEARTWQQRLLDALRDLDSLPDAFAAHREWRATWRSRAEDGLAKYANIQEEWPGTDSAVKAGVAAKALQHALDDLESQDADALVKLGARARELYRRGNEQVENDAPMMEQYATFTTALKFGELVPAFMQSDEGRKCVQHAADLRAAVEGFDTARKEIAALIAEGRHDEAFGKAVKYICTYPRSKLAGEMPMPVRFESMPQGARVFLDGEDTGQVTPGEIEIVPYAGSTLEFKADGFDDLALVLDPVTERDSRELRKLLVRSHAVTLQKRLAWATPPLAAGLVAPPTAVGTLVVVPTRSEQTELLDQADGVIKGSFATDGLDGLLVPPVAVSDDLVVLPALNGSVHFYDVRSRRELGTYAAPGEIRNPPLLLDAHLILPTESGRLVAVDVRTRKEVWRYPPRDAPPIGGGFVDGPARAKGELYVPGGDGFVHVVSAADGAEVRRIRVAGTARSDDGIAGLALAGGDLYVTTRMGRLLRLDRHAGTERWSTKLESPTVGRPALYGGFVILVTQDGDVVVHASADSERAGHFALGAAAQANGTLVDGVLYVGSAGGVLRALDVSRPTPRVLWEHRLPLQDGEPIAVTTPPTVTGGLVLFGAHDRVLRALVR